MVESRRYLFARICNYRHQYPRLVFTASVLCEWKELNRREIGYTREEDGGEELMTQPRAERAVANYSEDYNLLSVKSR